MWELVRANKRKSIIIAIVIAILLVVVGYFAGEIFFGKGQGEIGILFAFITWAILSITAMVQGKQIFLRISGAHKIKKEDHPRLYNVVEEMKIASMLPKMPDIYIIDDPAPNAFATGRNPENAAIAVTTGLLNRMNRDELQGVIAHEIGHIKNRDVLFMTFVGVMMGAIVIIADVTLRSLFWAGGRRRTRTSSSGGGQIQTVMFLVGLVLMILSPIVAKLLYLAASRKREYLADASSALFTRYPEGLASALEKIATSPVKMRKVNKVVAPMYIVNPLEKMNATSVGLFSTHPPVRERVKILRSMAGGFTFQDYDKAFRKITGSKSSVLPDSALKTPIEKFAVPIPTRARPEGKPAEFFEKVAAASILLEKEPESLGEKTRETMNAIWKSKNYRFINCDCGAILKVPPTFKRKSFKCLRCKKEHHL